MMYVARLTWLTMLGRNVLALTLATRKERTLPSRSTNDSTAAFFGTWFLRLAALPPTNVSSISTTLFLPPKPPNTLPSRIASRMRWVRNHVDLYDMPSMRWILWLDMPFLLADSR